MEAAIIVIAFFVWSLIMTYVIIKSPKDRLKWILNFHVSIFSLLPITGIIKVLKEARNKSG